MTNRLRLVGRLARGLLLSLVLAAVAASAQERDTLETKVTVDGTEITFKWSKKHPWDAELVAHGASLYADYRDSRGVLGTQCLQSGRTMPAVRSRGGAAPQGGCFTGNAVIRRDDRTIFFQLPEMLTAEPAGPVCLVLRLPDNRVVPVRRANRQGDETARFQADAWARGATRRKRLENLQRQRTEIEGGLATQAAEVTEQERSNAGHGWHSAEACQAVTVAPLAIAGSGRPIAPPDEQDAVARQVCIIRVAEGRPEQREVSPPHDIRELLALVPEPLAQRWHTLRGRQLQQFVDDWQRYSGSRPSYVKHYPVPHVGTYQSRVPIQSLAHLAYVMVRGAKPSERPLDPAWVLGYLGAKVEAYERCVTDARRQLDLNYREAIALKATLAGMPERLREQAIKSCQGGVARLSAMRAKATAFEADLARIDREITAIPTAPPPEKRRELNEVRCTP